MTTLNAAAYWNSHYGEEFVFGWGTEEILELLRGIPPVETWIDVGAGSESLLWACALSAERLVAVDVDERRLTRLRDYAGRTEPRGAYLTALALTGRTAAEWPAICACLNGTQVADCLNGIPPVTERAELVTQFGLLGLCPNQAKFRRCFAALVALAVPGGWVTGANWMARQAQDRVRLTPELYRLAAADCGVELTQLRRIPSADPAYPVIWAYVGRLSEEVADGREDRHSRWS